MVLNDGETAFVIFLLLILSAVLPIVAGIIFFILAYKRII